MGCSYCELLAGKKGVVYEEDGVAIMIHRSPAMPGHMLVLPTEHFIIMEQAPDTLIRKLATLANKVSTALLNVLGAAGTNIIVENGTGADQQVPHLAFNVIPRVEGDGLNFQWQPKKLSDEQMGLIELQLKEQAKDVGVVPEKKEPVTIGAAKPEAALKKDSYLTRQLRRRP